MAMTIPTIPTLPAGYIVTATDMNNLASAATFLLTKPIARVHDGAGSTAIGTSNTYIPFNTKDFDTDGMWSSGSPTLLTIQTPGFYKVEYMIDVLGTVAPGSMQTAVTITTGSNNPAGSGLTSTCWEGYACGTDTTSFRLAPHAAGVIPWYLYALDTVSVWAVESATGMTTSTSFPSYLALELVSI